MNLTAKRRLIVYSLSHLVIDFACYIRLFGYFSGQAEAGKLAVGFLVYNTIAFPTQMLIGDWFDRRRRSERLSALIGCGLAAAGLFAAAAEAEYAALILCAVGNAFFHVGGGMDSLIYSGGKYAGPGIFVAFGALGVSLGTKLGSSGMTVWPALAAVLICGVLIALFGKGEEETPVPGRGTTVRSERAADMAEWIVLLCVISVMIRSFAGFLVKMPWVGERLLWSFLPSFCAFVGKAFGGILADRYGARRIAVLTLGASLPLLCFGYSVPPVCGIGIILFNMTMAITAGRIFQVLPERPGFAFGLTTLGLWIGYLPGKVWAVPEAAKSILLPAAIVISAICLYLAIPGRQKKDGGGNVCGSIKRNGGGLE